MTSRGSDIVARFSMSAASPNLSSRVRFAMPGTISFCELEVQVLGWLKGKQASRVMVTHWCLLPLLRTEGKASATRPRRGGGEPGARRGRAGDLEAGSREAALSNGSSLNSRCLANR